MVEISSYRWRKPLLLMYNDNYRYGTNLYVPTVNSLDHRSRDYPIIPQYIPSTPAPLPKVPLAQYDLYAPVSYGYGRSLLKPRAPEVPTRSRISSSSLINHQIRQERERREMRTFTTSTVIKQ